MFLVFMFCILLTTSLAMNAIKYNFILCMKHNVHVLFLFHRCLWSQTKKRTNISFRETINVSLWETILTMLHLNWTMEICVNRWFILQISDLIVHTQSWLKTHIVESILLLSFFFYGCFYQTPYPVTPCYFC